MPLGLPVTVGEAARDLRPPIRLPMMASHLEDVLVVEEESADTLREQLSVLATFAAEQEQRAIALEAEVVRLTRALAESDQAVACQSTEGGPRGTPTDGPAGRPSNRHGDQNTDVHEELERALAYIEELEELVEALEDKQAGGDTDDRAAERLRNRDDRIEELEHDNMQLADEVRSVKQDRDVLDERVRALEAGRDVDAHAALQSATQEIELRLRNRFDDALREAEHAAETRFRKMLKDKDVECNNRCDRLNEHIDVLKKAHASRELLEDRWREQSEQLKERVSSLTKQLRLAEANRTSSERHVDRPLDSQVDRDRLASDRSSEASSSPSSSPFPSPRLPLSMANASQALKVLRRSSGVAPEPNQASSMSQRDSQADKYLLSSSPRTSPGQEGNRETDRRRREGPRGSNRAGGLGDSHEDDPEFRRGAGRQSYTRDDDREAKRSDRQPDATREAGGPHVHDTSVMSVPVRADCHVEVDWHASRKADGRVRRNIDEGRNSQAGTGAALEEKLLVDDAASNRRGGHRPDAAREGDDKSPRGCAVTHQEEEAEEKKTRNDANPPIRGVRLQPLAPISSPSEPPRHGRLGDGGLAAMRRLSVGTRAAGPAKGPSTSGLEEKSGDHAVDIGIGRRSGLRDNEPHMESGRRRGAAKQRESVSVGWRADSEDDEHKPGSD